MCTTTKTLLMIKICMISIDSSFRVYCDRNRPSVCRCFFAVCSRINFIFVGKMGNVIKRRTRDHENDFSNPEMSDLSFDEIEIVQRSWKIPNSKVRLSEVEDESIAILKHYFSAARFSWENFLRLFGEISTQSTCFPSFSKHTASNA